MRLDIGLRTTLLELYLWIRHFTYGMEDLTIRQEASHGAIVH